MTALEAIREYKQEHNFSRVADANHLKEWLEYKFKKKMHRPLFVSMGKGGGQTYKTLYEVFDVRHNSNMPSYFYNENPKAIEELYNNNHLPLDEWINEV